MKIDGGNGRCERVVAWYIRVISCDAKLEFKLDLGFSFLDGTRSAGIYSKSIKNQRVEL